MRKRWIIIVCVITVFLGTVLGGLTGYCVVKFGFKQCIKAEDNAQEQTFPEKHTQNGENLRDELSIVEVAQMCTESVVSITVKTFNEEYTGGSAYTETVLGHGTGVIVRENGYILTCHHVIDGADAIYVTLNHKTEHKAELVGCDEKFDLAVIRVDMEELPAAEIGDSDTSKTGEGVVIIGNPLGEFGSSVSAGVLSAPTRELTIAGVPLRLMQTDAAVNPGNSGGGMFNMQGELIAMVNAKISASGIEGIGFAIPINTIREKIDSIINNGHAGKTAALGVGTKTAKCYIDGQEIDCLEVVSVREGGAADVAGIRVGDFLLSADGKKLENNDDLSLIIKYHSAGDQIEIEVCRNKKRLQITAILEEKKD